MLTSSVICGSPGEEGRGLPKTWKNIQNSKGSMGGAGAKAVRKKLAFPNS